MKPFNLEEAKSGKPVCTRNGHKVRILCFDAKNEGYPILALIEENNEEYPYWYTINGKYLGNAYESYRDLMMMESEHHEGWINLYKCKAPFNKECHQTSVKVYDTKEKAIWEKVGNSNYIDTIKIEWDD